MFEIWAGVRRSEIFAHVFFACASLFVSLSLFIEMDGWLGGWVFFCSGFCVSTVGAPLLLCAFICVCMCAYFLHVSGLLLTHTCTCLGNLYVVSFGFCLFSVW